MHITCPNACVMRILFIETLAIDKPSVINTAKQVPQLTIWLPKAHNGNILMLIILWNECVGVNG